MELYDQIYSRYTVAEESNEVRAQFYKRTYAWLAGAIAAFAVLEALALQTALPTTLMGLLSGRGGVLVFMLGYMGIAWVAENMANNATSRPVAIAGMSIYVLLQVVLFAPILAILTKTGGGAVIPAAAVLTGAIFMGLTVTAFTTKQDFSFMRAGLTIFSFIALGLIICSFAFNLALGVWFSAIMIVFASLCILYQTSQIIHKYRADQEIAAALSLFSSVMLLFWYILRFMRR